MAIELKVNAPLEPLQLHKLKLIKKAHGISMVMTPENFESLYKELKQLAQLKGETT